MIAESYKYTLCVLDPPQFGGVQRRVAIIGCKTRFMTLGCALQILVNKYQSQRRILNTQMHSVTTEHLDVVTTEK